MRALGLALLIAFGVWLVLTAVAAAFGGLMSFYTGKVEEIPKWNGWSYFFFSVKEIGIMGAVLTLPIAVCVFFGTWLEFWAKSRRRDNA